ncbi:MAG TPA: glycerol-3-phosphate 1-O-acyltransferase PlsY [Acidobacteriaceae bacterium]|nr:glycerol-3-phosphate 1-O-acyltransferase PlsY [Acidobacteriaceae bacterium]
MLWLLTLAIAYLLGSIPFGYILVRLFRKEDIRTTGSGNIGATNVVRSGAKGLGILTLVLDLLKGVAAVLIARHLAPGTPGFPSDLAVLAGVAAVIGHIFPVWLGFKGGKGVATALGVFLALAPFAAVCSLGVFIAVFAFTRYVSLASILAAVFLPLFAMLLMPDRSPIFIGGVIFLALLVIAKHRANIARLMSGTESRFGKKSKQVSA